MGAPDPSRRPKRVERVVPSVRPSVSRVYETRYGGLETVEFAFAEGQVSGRHPYVRTTEVETRFPSLPEVRSLLPSDATVVRDARSKEGYSTFAVSPSATFWYGTITKGVPRYPLVASRQMQWRNSLRTSRVGCLNRNRSPAPQRSTPGTGERMGGRGPANARLMFRNGRRSPETTLSLSHRNSPN